MPSAPAFDAVFRAGLRELLVWRRDVRRFRPDPLPRGSIEKVLELACLAPSVGLSQPWRFILVDDPLRRAAVRHNFETCNAEALAGQEPERAVQYPRLSSCLRSFKNFFILGADANANPRGAPELAARPALGETSLTSTYCGLIDAPRLTYSRINSIRGHYTKVL